MIDLLKLKCKEPIPGELPLTDKEINDYLPLINGWRLLEGEGEKGLGKRFPFKNFSDGLAFTNQVAALAEEENHHPGIFLAWGRVIISWRTHKVKGLSLNDFIMAAKTDEMYKNLAQPV